MARRTSPEIEAIKSAVKPLTPGERAAIKARQQGETPPEEEIEAEAEVSPALEGALKARAMQLGVPVSALTQDQIAEVRDSLPGAEPPKGRISKKKVSAPKPEPEPEPKPKPELGKRQGA